jgi:hypothetical protein
MARQIRGHGWHSVPRQVRGRRDEHQMCRPKGARDIAGIRQLRRTHQRYVEPVFNEVGHVLIDAEFDRYIWVTDLIREERSGDKPLSEPRRRMDANVPACGGNCAAGFRMRMADVCEDCLGAPVIARAGFGRTETSYQLKSWKPRGVSPSGEGGSAAGSSVSGKSANVRY